MWLVAALASAFNLQCTGQHWSGNDFSLMLGGAPTENFVMDLRVDLERKRWCWGSCTETSAIAEIGTTSITFIDRKSNNGEHTARVNRETGEYNEGDFTYSPERFAVYSGKCERRPFTGLPSLKF